MKKYAWLLMVSLMGLCSACSQCPESDEPDSDFQVFITVNQMIGEEETSRSYGSMTPDRENSIKSLSVFQFDMEGELRTLDASNNKRYIYKKFTDLGDPNGIPRVTNEDMPQLSLLQTGERMYTCLIANIDETLLYNTLFPRGEDDPVTWTEFQGVEFVMPFASASDIELDATLEPGHLTTTYMFGYYDGDVPPTGFTIGLGRILTRLKINFVVDGLSLTDEDIDKLDFYAALENLETYAYFSVAKDSPHEHYSDSNPHKLDPERFDLTSTGIAAGKSILQFYCAPHVGTRIDADNCTCLYFWRVRKKNDGELDVDYATFLNNRLKKDYAARIPLCADWDNGQYQLARNTFYSFNVRLRNPEASGGDTE